MRMTQKDHDSMRADSSAYRSRLQRTGDTNIELDIGRRAGSQLVERLQQGKAQPADVWHAMRMSLQHKSPDADQLERGVVEALAAAVVAANTIAEG